MITTMDGLITGMANGKNQPFMRMSVASVVSGGFNSLWRGRGLPVQGNIPTTFETCTNALAGAFLLPSVTTEKVNIGRLEITSSIASTFILVDRLVHMGGLSGTTTTEQTFNSTTGMTLTDAYNAGRCAVDGSDVDWFLEWYVSTGSSAVSTSTFKYYDQTDTLRTLSNTIAIPASTVASRMIQLLPSAGQTIKTAYSATITTTSTAGNFGVTAVRRLFSFSVPIANTMVVLDFAGTGLHEVASNACLMLIQIPTSTTTGDARGSITTIKG